MTRRTRDRNDVRRQDGFTLVETLVAVTVVAIVSVSLQRGFVATRQALARAEGVFSGEAVARSILETRLGDLAAAPGERRGTTDGRAWTVTSEPLDLRLPPPAQPQAASASAKPEPVWRTLRVTITVDCGSGPPIVVETVHLARDS